MVILCTTSPNYCLCTTLGNTEMIKTAACLLDAVLVYCQTLTTGGLTYSLLSVTKELITWLLCGTINSMSLETRPAPLWAIAEKEREMGFFALWQLYCVECNKIQFTIFVKAIIGTNNTLCREYYLLK